LLVLSENGFGKRSALEEYRITNRGGKGVKTLNVTGKTGHLVGIMGVIDTDDIMIINKSGITIRLRVADLRVIGRVSQGVRLIRLNDGDAISSVAKIEVEDKEDVTLSESDLPASEVPLDEALNPEDMIDPITEDDLDEEPEEEEVIDPDDSADLLDPDTLSEN
jgi:DNA gyrase subunit A